MMLARTARAAAISLGNAQGITGQADRKATYRGLGVAAMMAAAALVAGPRTTQAMIQTDGTQNFDLTGMTAWSQYVGNWGWFTGVPIDATHFITSSHIGAPASMQFALNGTNYAVSGGTERTDLDLTIWQIKDGTFSTYASLFTGSNEAGQTYVAAGRGVALDHSAAGTVKNSQNQVVGWKEAAYTKAQNLSWATGTISSAVTHDSIWGTPLLYFGFDQSGPSSYASNGDSGGAVFINDGGVYKLAAIVTDTDLMSSNANGSNSYFAALYDKRGLYSSPDDGTTWSKVTGSSAVPVNTWGSRISTSVGWIEGVLRGTAPANVSRVSAVSLSGLSAEAMGDNVLAPSNTVWWKWTALTDGAVTFDTSGSDIATTLKLYDGGSTTALLSGQGGLFLAHAIAGDTYYLSVTSAGSDQGSIWLDISQVPEPGSLSLLAAGAMLSAGRPRRRR